MKKENKLQQSIKHIKTMFYTFIGCKFKRTYGYYYYICFKDFIKKLLKPKKMIAVKWRISNEHDFQYYTEIMDDLIFKSSPIIFQGEYNQKGKIYEFEIDNFDPAIRQETIKYCPIESFRIVTNNNGVDYIITKNIQHIRIILDCKINGIYENNIKIDFDIKKMLSKNNNCILKFDENWILFIDSKNDLVSITDNTLGLKKRDISEFIKRFKTQ